MVADSSPPLRPRPRQQPAREHPQRKDEQPVEQEYGAIGHECLRFITPLMVQFVSHRVKQLRQVKGLLEGLTRPEEFRNIQDILFPS